MKTRVISALILLPIGLLLIWIGGWPLYIALAFVFSLAALEFTQLMKLGNFSPNVVFAIAFVLVLLVAVAIPNLAQFTQAAIAFLLIAALTWQMRHREGAPVADWALAVAGGIYLGTAGEYFILLRQLPSGERWLLLALAGTWLADSGAFFVGRQIGKHKMTPGLSPKKSWEGLVGGAVIGFILNALLAWAFGLPPVAGAMLGLIGALVGTLGDLSISMIKRQVGAKDSGHIIPGHGGVLDRLDSSLFTAIVSYYFIIWFVR